MTALDTDRNTPQIDGALFTLPVAAATKIYAGSLVAIDASGNANDGDTATGLRGIGRAEEQVDNSAGLAGAKTVNVRTGVFRFGNSGSSDAITNAEIGSPCYIVDDQTVAKTSGSGTRSVAGLVHFVDASGVWVDLRPHHTVSTSGAVLTANNLSDVNAGTARGNLGVFLDHMGDPTIAAPGAESGNVITTAVQLTTIAGADLAAHGAVFGYLAADANGDAVSALTIASLANGTDGEVLALDAANKTFVAISEADGDIDIAVGCAGAGTCYLILITPRGKLVASAAITFA